MKTAAGNSWLCGCEPGDHDLLPGGLNRLRNETTCPLPLYPTLQRGNVHTVEPRVTSRADVDLSVIQYPDQAQAFMCIEVSGDMMLCERYHHTAPECRQSSGGKSTYRK